MENQTSKFVNCSVSFDGYDWRNLVTIKSPTGRSISLTANWKDSISKELRNLFTFLNDAWQEARFGTGVQKTDFLLSPSAMKEAFDISGAKPIEKKSKSFKHRKFEAFKNIDKSTCCCGGTLKTNDHGSWVGYFCPKCGGGGSYNKKR